MHILCIQLIIKQFFPLVNINVCFFSYTLQQFSHAKKKCFAKIEFYGKINS